MAQNELGHAVPAEVEAKSLELGCRDTKYVYRDGDYGGKFPCASIGVKKPTRFRSAKHEKFKIPLVSGWVAFQSPKDAYDKRPVIKLEGTDSPSLPVSRVNAVTSRKRIDGSPLIFKIIDQEVFIAPSNRLKAYLLQEIEMDDGDGTFRQTHREYRIAYYMVGHKGRARGRWAFGQYAPIMTADDLSAILEAMGRKGWITISRDPKSEG